MPNNLTNNGQPLNSTQETLAAIASRLSVLQGGSSASTKGTEARANANVNSNSSSSSSSQTRPTNPLVEALTARLLQQGQGISSSSSSNLQNSINEAIAQTQRSGDLSSEALQIERGREVGFMRDRAAATYTTALEGRTGYATMTAGLRELTEITEKEIKDLDGRYQQAILSNDAATAQRISDLTVQKLQFQQQQEQNYFSNLISVAGIQQQDDQFYASFEQNERQFAANMANSQYQFERNLGVKYKELDLAAQELELSRERNQISWAEYNLQKAKLDAEKNNTVLGGIFTQFVDRQIKNGTYTGVDQVSGELKNQSVYNVPAEQFVSDFLAANPIYAQTLTDKDMNSLINYAAEKQMSVKDTVYPSYYETPMPNFWSSLYSGSGSNKLLESMIQGSDIYGRPLNR